MPRTSAELQPIALALEKLGWWHGMWQSPLDVHAILSPAAVNFLRSGTKLIFRRKNKQKEAGLSQSHDDLPNAGASSSGRKKSGSFSRRLIKRFSFKSKPKPKANGSTLAMDKH